MKQLARARFQLALICLEGLAARVGATRLLWPSFI